MGGFLDMQRSGSMMVVSVTSHCENNAIRGAGSLAKKIQKTGPLSENLSTPKIKKIHHSLLVEALNKRDGLQELINATGLWRLFVQVYTNTTGHRLSSVSCERPQGPRYQRVNE